MENKKTPLLRILNSSRDQKGLIFIDVLIGECLKISKEKTFVMSQKTAKYLIYALNCAIKNQKFVRGFLKENLKGGKNKNDKST